MRAFKDEIGQASEDLEVNIELPAGTYKWSLEDHMGNRQQKEFTIAEGEKSFTIDSSELPAGWLNRYKKQFVLRILDESNSPVPFKMKGSFTIVVLDVVGNEIADNKIGETI